MRQRNSSGHAVLAAVLLLAASLGSTFAMEPTFVSSPAESRPSGAGWSAPAQRMDMLAGAELIPITGEAWDETAVRKVLHTFAYGGLTTESQINAWASMAPSDAIAEILTFSPINGKLSPVQDASAEHGESLESMQALWASDSADNPVRPDRRSIFNLVGGGEETTATYINPIAIEWTWIRSVTSRGINPFLHKTAFFLTNYLLAQSVSKTGHGLMRSYYDRVAQSLSEQKSLVEVIAEAAVSAALARSYGHVNNFFVPAELLPPEQPPLFFGNDDFAREFYQLGFRIHGETEAAEYHEETTIESTARAFTGMGIDLQAGPYGLPEEMYDYVAPIVFTDHTDAAGRSIWNQSLHHMDCLEALHQLVCGDDASAKIAALAQVAASHVESLTNLPVYIVGFFADDNLTSAKTDQVIGSWISNSSTDLLEFLRLYAISTAFHSSDTWKFRTAFDRNLTIQNLNTIDNEESFSRELPPILHLYVQDARVFEPAHKVLGNQRGVDAANSSGLFQSAYSMNVFFPAFLGDTEETYVAAEGGEVTWRKDWSQVIPSGTGPYLVEEVASWLWQHFIADDGKNYDAIARAQLHSILATGYDFGLIMTLFHPTAQPDDVYSSEDITDPAGFPRFIDAALASLPTGLGSADPALSQYANLKVGLAVNFITATPYTFVLEGK